MEGFIKLHRKFEKWEWASDPRTAYVFIRLLLKASHQTYRFQGMTIKKGQLIFGLRAFSAETGVSYQSVRTAISKLESTSEITRSKYPKCSVITITNWDKYQVANTELTTNQHTSNTLPTTHKNVKNEKKLKNNSNSSSAINSSIANKKENTNKIGNSYDISINDLNDNQRSIKFNYDIGNWDFNEGYSFYEDFKNIFPDIKQDLLLEELNSLSDVVKNKSEEQRSKSKHGYGFTYLYRCLFNSNYRNTI